MARKVTIYKQVLGRMFDFNIQGHIDNMSKEKTFVGELSHNSEFLNSHNSKLCDMTKVSFVGKLYDQDHIMIDLPDTKHGRFLSDLLDSKSDKVKFVPRVLVTNSGPDQLLDIELISFDAIINDKELWDRL